MLSGLTVEELKGRRQLGAELRARLEQAQGARSARCGPAT